MSVRSQVTRAGSRDPPLDVVDLCRREDPSKVLTIAAGMIKRSPRSPLGHRLLIATHVRMAMDSKDQDEQQHKQHLLTALRAARAATLIVSNSLGCCLMHAQLAATMSDDMEAVVRECESAVNIANPIDPLDERVDDSIAFPPDSNPQDRVRAVLALIATTKEAALAKMAASSSSSPTTKASHPPEYAPVPVLVPVAPRTHTTDDKQADLPAPDNNNNNNTAGQQASSLPTDSANGEQPMSPCAQAAAGSPRVAVRPPQRRNRRAASDNNNNTISRPVPIVVPGADSASAGVDHEDDDDDSDSDASLGGELSPVPMANGFDREESMSPFFLTTPLPNGSSSFAKSPLQGLEARVARNLTFNSDSKQQEPAGEAGVYVYTSSDDSE